MLNQNKISSFLNLYQGNQTKKTYKSALRYFFSSVYPEEVFIKRGKQSQKDIDSAMQILEKKAQDYFLEKRDIEQDIINFQKLIEKRPPTTIRLFFTVLRTFLIENDVELTEKFWRRVRRRINGSKAVTRDEVPDNKKLRQILTHMTTKGKALFLTLASSGMRIGETLKLELDDIDLESSPAKIDILRTYTKSGNRRITFISSEAKEALLEWLKIRDESLKVSVKRSTKYKKNIEDKRVFPFESNTAQFMWNEALRKSGLAKRDKETNRRTIHIHVLRKFFRSRIALAMPLDMVEALMGHEGYLTGSYRKYTEKQLAEKYLEAEHTVAIFREMGDVTKLREKVEKENTVLRTMVIDLQSQMNNMRSEMKKTLQRFQEEINQVKKELN